MSKQPKLRIPKESTLTPPKPSHLHSTWDAKAYSMKETEAQYTKYKLETPNKAGLETKGPELCKVHILSNEQSYKNLMSRLLNPYEVSPNCTALKTHSISR